jgi:tetratricopeptide (TPR) repeat protein
VIGIYRDDELTRVHPLGETLAALRRDQLFERVLVGGLGRADVEHLLLARTGQDAAPALADALFDTTEGNPFFLGEVLRHLDETGALAAQPTRDGAISIDELGLPEGVREVVGRRLLRLSPDANHVLSLASVVGRSFRLDVLEEVSELSGDSVLDAVEEATAARLVDEAPGAFGRYSFSHVLIRETLYRELATARRARLHRRIGEALEGLADPNTHLAELAYHFYEAAGAGGVDLAVEYCRRAGDHASSVLAFEEAAEHYEQALQALELGPDATGHRRGELLIAVGESWWRAGVRDRSRDSFLRAVELARASSDGELLGAAALGVGTGKSSQEGFDVSGAPDELVIGLLEESLGLLPDADSPLRARLLGRLAVSLYWSAPRERLAELSNAAVAMAERTGDKTALLGVLISRNFALWGPADPDARLGAANEILHLAEALGRADRALEARLYRIIVLFELGDLDAADHEIEVFCRNAIELRQPFYRWYAAVLPATRALIVGEFDEAERLAHEALALAEQAQDPAAVPVWGAQMLFLWWERDQRGELEAAMDAIREIAGTMTAVAATSVWMAVQLGRDDDAREQLDVLAAEGFDYPLDASWLSSMAALAGACAALGDVERGREVYLRLVPFSGRNVTAWATATLGPVDLYLGQLATAFGDYDDATARFEAALALCESMHSPRFEAHTQCAYASMLAERGGPDDRGHAEALRAQARERAATLGMTMLASRLAD